MRMLLAYVLIFLLHLSASTCYATSRNQHLFFAGRGVDDDATALLPAAMIHRHHHHHTAKAEVISDDNYNDVHYHPATMMARWGEGASPRPPSTSSPGVDLAGVGGAPPPPLVSVVEPSDVEGVAPPPPPPPVKQDTSAAIEPSPSPMPSSPHGEGASSSSSDASAKDASAASDDVDHADYDGPMTHPPSHN